MLISLHLMRIAQSPIVHLECGGQRRARYGDARFGQIQMAETRSHWTLSGGVHASAPANINAYPLARPRDESRRYLDRMQ